MLSRATLQRTDWNDLLLTGIAIAGCGLIISLLVINVTNKLFLLAAIVAPLVVLTILVKPEWGLLMLVFLVYTRFSDVLIAFQGMPSVAKPFIAMLVGIILMRWLLFNEQPKGWERPALFLAGYGLIGLGSLLYAADPDRVQNGLINFAKDAVIMLIVVVLLQRAATLRRVIWVLLAAGIFMGTITTFQQLTGTFDNNYWGFGQAVVANIVGRVSDYRIGGPGLGPNAYGQFLLLLVPLALERLWHEQNRFLRLAAAWAFTVCVLSIVFTFSRGVFLGLAVVLIIMLVQRPPRPLALLATILLGATLLQFLPDRYTERMATIAYIVPAGPIGSGDTDMIMDIGYEARGEVSFRGRLSENIAGLQMFADHPILGVGLNHYNYYYQDYSRRLGLDSRREDRSAHNLYLEIASEMGIVGLTWFFALQWVTFRGLKQAQIDFKQAGLPEYAGIAAAVTVVVIGFLVTSVFRHMAHARYVWLLYGIALAIPHVARHELLRSTTTRLQHTIVRREI